MLPRDHGAHPAQAIEWWYLTGWLVPQGRDVTTEPALAGFQVTFFRVRTALPGTQAMRSRYAPRHLLFAHAALGVPGAGPQASAMSHASRIGRWDGRSRSEVAPPCRPRTHASIERADLAIDGWLLRQDEERRWHAQVDAADWALSLVLVPTQPPLLQGDAGWSRKGPQPAQASHYISEPQLHVHGSVRLPAEVRGTANEGRIGDAARTSSGAQAVAGRGWMDHEWSDELLGPSMVGWDWIGINLNDGSALTAFRLRNEPGEPAWAGGSWRAAGASAAQAFEADAVRWIAGRRWTSPATGATYPVQWSVITPAGRFEVQALLDAQELDERRSTGTVYWEGLARVLDEGGREIGRGYLEMTGYAARLQLGAR